MYYVSKNCKSPSFKQLKMSSIFRKVNYVRLYHTKTNQRHTAPWKLFLTQKQRERNQMSNLDISCVNLLIFITTRLGLRTNVESEGGESK